MNLSCSSIDAKLSKSSFVASRPEFLALAAQYLRLATGPAEHKITKTQAKFEKDHHHCRTQRRWQNHFCP
jgi:hypothetical protein